MPRDIRKLYTPREATALYNLNKIKFNPGAYSLKENLILNKSLRDNAKEHILEYDFDTEKRLLANLIETDVCEGSEIISCLPEGTYGATKGRADDAVVKQTNLSASLQYLEDFVHLVPKDIKGSVFMDAYIRMLIALSSSESCANEMYWLPTSLKDTSYTALHNFEPLKKALASGGKVPVAVKVGPVETICNPIRAGAVANPAMSTFHMTASVYKSYLYTMEVLWAYKRIADPELQRALAWAVVVAGPCPEYAKELYDVSTTEIEPTADVAALISLNNPAERFAAYQQWLKENESALLKKASTFRGDTLEPYYNNPLMAVFVSFAEACAVTHVRINNIRILYECAKANKCLPKMPEIDFDESTSEFAAEVAKVTPKATDTSGSSATSEAEGRSKSLMDLGDTPKAKGGVPKGGSDDSSAVFEALDKLDAEFKADRYRFTAKDVRVADDVTRAKYNAVCEKVSLLNKNLIRRIKAIKTYNTGGKNPGQRTGKLDRKALYKYKQTSDIFYNNTYKTLESDLAFGVILDISGSMLGRGIENGRTTMIVLHETLKALGINHSIIGHTCYGRDYTCDIERYQSFREDKTYTVCKNYAIANLEAKSGNCDSGALYYMEKALERVHNKDKIVLMFSDGAPTECTGTDLIEQVKSMERKGIKVIGIGINFPSISKYYTDYANGRNLKDMLDIVSNILEEYVLKKKDV